MIQSYKDIEKIIRWAVDSDLKTFAEDAYGVTGSAYDLLKDEYLTGKFQQMQSNFIMWIAGLSEGNRDRLARNISSYIDERRTRITFKDNE